MNNVNPVTIVLIDDDPGHSRLVEKNLRRSNIPNPIIKLSDGRQALDYLLGEGEYSEHNPLPSPILVLLDLNLPVLDGYQVLRRLKADERTRHIPIIILTSTDDPREVDRCYELGCNIYITKPVAYDKFSEAMQKLGLFLSIVMLPADG